MSRFKRNADSNLFYDLLCFALIFLAVWLSFSRVLAWYFMDVDTLPLISTGRFASWEDLAHILTRPLMQGLMTNARFFRPLSSLTWGIDEKLWGLSARGYHLTDLAIHASNALLLFVFVRNSWLVLGRDESPNAGLGRRGREARIVGFGAALVFAINPVQAEFLPAVARRPDLLTGFFLLLTLNTVLSHVRRPQRWQLPLSALFCFLGLAAKETAILIPGTALLLLLLAAPCMTAGQRARTALLRGWPLLAVTALFLLWRTLVLGGLGGYAPRPRPDLWMEFLVGLGVQLAVFFTPGHLDQILVWPLQPAVLGGAAVAVLALGVVCFRAVGAAWHGRPDRFLTWLFACLLSLMFFQLLVGALLPRQMYVHTVFYSIALAWMAFSCIRDLLRFLVHEPRRNALWWSILPRSAGLLALVGLIGSSPLLGRSQTLELWRRTGELSRAILGDCESLLSTVGQDATVYLVNFPYALDFGDRRSGLPEPDAPVLLEHSVQGWVDMRFPEKRFDVIGLTYLIINASGTNAPKVRTSFERGPGALEVEVTEGGAVTWYPWPIHYARHDYRQIFQALARFSGPGTIDYSSLRLLIFEKHLRGPAVFLIYSGHGVELRGIENWVVPG